MRAPLSWLRDFAPFENDAKELAATFDDLGLVVEGIYRVGEGLEEVVVARVLEIGAIPGAERIRRVTVDAGGEPVEVVCGAWNFEVGDLVPLALPGSTLPGGVEIARRQIKGVESGGMLCSGKELGLSEDAAGIFLLSSARGSSSVLLEPGSTLAEALGIEADVVFDLAIETNRPDAMCMAGVARDAAARLGLPFAIREPVVVASGQAVQELATVGVESPDLCPRFTGRVITKLEVTSSPDWVARRLVLAGMRPINSVVDASNYVMLELGHPNHPYDLDRLAGQGVVVRAAREGETVVTLDGVSRVVGLSEARDCLICDATGAAVGIGGIMGGAGTEISELTSRVFLETAYFAPMAIARTSRRLGLRTEASARFERGVDPEGLERAAARFCELVGAVGNGATVAPGILDWKESETRPVKITVRTSRVNSILGTDLTDERIRDLLTPIGFEVFRLSTGIQEVVVPTFRPDSSREIDIIEEVARHYGYSRIARTVPVSPRVGRLSAWQRKRRLVRQVLAIGGFSEAWTPTLIGPEDDARTGLEGSGIEAENPLAREESVLRRSLLPGLLKAIWSNVSRRQLDVRLFEIGHVFGWPAPGVELPDEHEHLAVALAGPGDGAESAVTVWRGLAEWLRLAEVRLEMAELRGLHPTRSARLVANSKELGVVGEVDPTALARYDLAGYLERVGWIEVDLGAVFAAPVRDEQARPLSRFPSSDIDLAFVVDDSATADDVEATLREAGGRWLEHVQLFDVYRGDAVGRGRRSLAFRLRFCAMDRTLTDEEVSAVRRACIDAVESAHPARLR